MKMTIAKASILALLLGSAMAGPPAPEGILKGVSGEVDPTIEVVIGRRGYSEEFRERLIHPLAIDFHAAKPFQSPLYNLDDLAQEEYDRVLSLAADPVPNLSQEDVDLLRKLLVIPESEHLGVLLLIYYGQIHSLESLAQFVGDDDVHAHLLSVLHSGISLVYPQWEPHVNSFLSVAMYSPVFSTADEINAVMSILLCRYGPEISSETLFLFFIWAIDGDRASEFWRDSTMESLQETRCPSLTANRLIIKALEECRAARGALEEALSVSASCQYLWRRNNHEWIRPLLAPVDDDDYQLESFWLALEAFEAGQQEIVNAAFRARLSGLAVDSLERVDVSEEEFVYAIGGGRVYFNDQTRRESRHGRRVARTQAILNGLGGAFSGH